MCDEIDYPFPNLKLISNFILSFIMYVISYQSMKHRQHFQMHYFEGWLWYFIVKQISLKFVTAVAIDLVGSGDGLPPNKRESTMTHFTDAYLHIQALMKWSIFPPMLVRKLYWGHLSRSPYYVNATLALTPRAPNHTKKLFRLLRIT